MNQVRAIAVNTFKEAVRNRVLYVVLIFSLILIGASGVLSELTVASRDKIVKDLGFAAINFFGVAIAIFVGVTLVYNELEKRTIYTLVSKPIHRWQFLLGKYFGLLMTIYVNVVVMSVFFLFVIHWYAAMEAERGVFTTFFLSAAKALVGLLWWDGFPPTRNIMPVVAATAIELAIVTAFSILYSAFSTPTLSMFFTVLTFIAGRLNEDIVLFAENVRDTALETGTPLPLSYYLAQGAAHVTPNLGVFHQSVEQALYADEVTIWWQSILYGLIYTSAILLLSMLIFSRRNFK